jgi:hypothetical protein
MILELEARIKQLEDPSAGASSVFLTDPYYSPSPTSLPPASPAITESAMANHFLVGGALSPRYGNDSESENNDAWQLGSLRDREAGMIKVPYRLYTIRLCTFQNCHILSDSGS